jgi:O-acetyl-ADP-ribose deacetylase (regulator of RNase III)
MDSRTYHVGPSRISLVFDNILNSKAQVLVSSDDYMLSMGGGVSAAIRITAGSALTSEAQKAVPAKAGDVVVTSGGGLKARYVFHAVTIGLGKHGLEPGMIVRQATQKAMRLLPMLNCRSIAFPAIGTGAAGIPFETTAAEMAGALIAGLLESPYPLEVDLFLGRATADVEHFFNVFEAFAADKLGLLTTRSAATLALQPPSDERGGQASAMLRHLDARRNELEARLLPALEPGAAVDPAGIQKLRSQLAEVQELRRGYEAGNAGVPAPEPARSDSVFVSSTSNDLQPYRQAVEKVVSGLGLKFIGMEDFGASAEAPATLIRRKVDESDHYVGIIGMRYGYVDPGSGLSMTELEYRQAVASRKDIFLFVMDKDAPITAGMVETDPQGYAKLLEFRGRIMKAHTCGLFNGPEDLSKKVGRTLAELKR